PVSAELLAKLESLGPAILAFQKTCDRLYFDSAEGRAPAWIARLLDQGKPEAMIELGRQRRWRESIPRVLRPDLILTETGVSITELDSLPGGIGLTGWLAESYTALGESIIGGAAGMVEGFSKAFPGHDVLISRESSGYQPEMEWLLEKLNALEGGARRMLT